MPHYVSKHHYRRNHFKLQRSTNGCDETYDVVYRGTGEAVAFLPFWYDDAGAKQDAQLLIKALTALYNRGGQFFDDALLRVNTEFDAYPALLVEDL